MRIVLPRTSLALGFGLALSLSAAHAQNLGVTLPGSATLFRPRSNFDEGVLTHLPLRVSVYSDIGYDDNVFDTHSDRQGSGFNTLGVILESNIGNQRTRLDAILSAGFVAYWDRPGNTIAPDVSLNLNFSHQLNPRAIIGFSSFLTYQDQPDVALGVDQSNRTGSYFYSANTLSFGYQWTRRFSTVSSYTLSTLFYEDSQAADIDDRLEHLFSQQFRFLVLPTVTAVAEYRFGYVQYLNANNDSYSHYLLGGADFSLSPKLSFGFRAGAEFRTLEGPNSGDEAYPYFESTLTYLYQPGSSLEWVNRYGLEQPDLSGPGYRRTYRTGIRVSHRFGEKLRGVAEGYYSYNDYTGPINFTENIFDISAELSYQITRPFAIRAGYTFTRDFSDVTSRDYYRNRVYVGGVFTF